MKTNKNLILEYCRDFKNCVEPCVEEFVAPVNNAGVSVSAVEEQLANIRKRINKLAMFVGMPHVIHLDESLMTLYPARKGNVNKVSKEAVSYVVNLQPFREDFAAVRFKANNFLCEEPDIVRGLIIDDEGNVECECDNRYGTGNPWTRLPISGISQYLIATVPLKDGEPLWTPDRVEFLPQGLAQDVAEVADELIKESIDLGNRIAPLVAKCEKCPASNS